MRVSFEKRGKGQIEFGLIYGGILLLGLFAARFLPLFGVLPACVFRGVTGLPCPTCGLTRAVIALSKGDVMTAIAMNPLLSALMVAALFYGMYCAVTYMFLLRRVRIAFDEHEGNMIRAAVLLLFGFNWIYLCSFL